MILRQISSLQSFLTQTYFIDLTAKTLQHFLYDLRSLQPERLHGRDAMSSIVDRLVFARKHRSNLPIVSASM